MKRIITAIIGLSIAAGFLSCRLVRSIVKPSLIKKAYIVNVIDGDTVELKGGRILRYIGIDTPELKRFEDGKWVPDIQTLAVEARQLNVKLVKNKLVDIQYDRVTHDRYNRLLGYVFVDDTFVNERLLENGLAFFMYFPPNVAHADRLLAAVKQAHLHDRGLWGEAKNNILTADLAYKAIGEAAVIEGIILNIKKTKKVTYLNFGHDYRTDFTGIIFQKCYPLFEGTLDIKGLQGKHVRITGIVKEYNGPEIIISSPEQIYVQPS